MLTKTVVFELGALGAPQCLDLFFVIGGNAVSGCRKPHLSPVLCWIFAVLLLKKYLFWFVFGLLVYWTETKFARSFVVTPETYHCNQKAICGGMSKDAIPLVCKITKTASQLSACHHSGSPRRLPRSRSKPRGFSPSHYQWVRYSSLVSGHTLPILTLKFPSSITSWMILLCRSIKYVKSESFLITDCLHLLPIQHISCVTESYFNPKGDLYLNPTS